MTIYISIPMRGHNLEKQEAKAKAIQNKLEEQGYTVLNPFELAKEYRKLVKNPTEEQYLAFDIHMIERHAKAMFMCQGWPNSVGCVEEVNAAIKKKLWFYIEEKYKFI